MPTDFGESVEFIFNDYDPIQTGVVSGTIDLDRVAVLRGKLLSRGGAALSGATISILNHPEFGQTLSRADGMFDLAVNGGGSLTVSYVKIGYLTVQRQIVAPWQDFSLLPDVVMIQADSQATTVNLTTLTQIKEARGSVVHDADGTRQATLLFQPGTAASMVLPGGITRTLSTMTVRASEYTVGLEGPKSMPAALPPTSGYTYAVEFSVDEANAVAATDVRFTKPVIFHLDNFLDFPVGGIVPVGYYDRSSGQWVPADNGRIIKILSISGDMAVMDIDGSGNPASSAALAALGVTDAERAKLATLYTAGKSLWRVAVTHFTPWDCNWPVGPPPKAYPPPEPERPPKPRKCPPCTGPCCTQNEQAADTRSQTLSQNITIPDAPFDFSYSSSRAPGNDSVRTMSISLSGPALLAPAREDSRPAQRSGPDSGTPPLYSSIKLEMESDGVALARFFGPGPSQNFEFTWDMEDAYGREVRGSRPLHANLCYVYPGYYYKPSEFERAFAAGTDSGVVIGGNRSTGEVSLCRSWTTYIENPPAPAEGGEWAPSVQHTYDPDSDQLYEGDGGSREVHPIGIGAIIDTVAGGSLDETYGIGGPAVEANIQHPLALVSANDGSFYFINNGFIAKVDTQGIVNYVVYGRSGFGGDGGPALEAQLNYPSALAVGPDGSLYIADTRNNRIRRVSTAGIISTVAGNGQTSCSFTCGDGGPATAAALYEPQGITVGPDGSIYIADTYHRSVRKVAPNGIISSVVGGFSGACCVAEPSGVSLGPDGSVYVADTGWNVVWSLKPNGEFDVVVGSYGEGFAGDGGPALAAKLNNPTRVDAGPDGELYIADTGNGRIRFVDTSGIITTIAGNGVNCFTLTCGDGGPAAAAQLDEPADVTLASFGALLIADSGNGRVRQVQQFENEGYISTVAGNGRGCYPASCGDGGLALGAPLINMEDTAVGPDGAVYIADTWHNRIRRIDDDGSITTVAGNGDDGFSGDGGQATIARLDRPEAVALGPDNSLYIGDLNNRRIRKVDLFTGIINTVAGCGTDYLTCVNEGPGPAAQRRIYPSDLDVAPDGTVYFTDFYNIRRLTADGMIVNVAGGSDVCPESNNNCGDGGPATQALLTYPNVVVVAPDGSIYVAEHQRVRRIGTDGIIRRVAGTGGYSSTGDGGPAIEATFRDLRGLAVAADGAVYTSEFFGNRIRRIDPEGIIGPYAGNGTQCGSPRQMPDDPCGDGGSALAASMTDPAGIALGPDGRLYIAETFHRLRVVGLSEPGTYNGELLVPSQDGQEVYVFSGRGRHLRTLDALTGAVVRAFVYDAEGRLIAITDSYSNTTTLERDSDGHIAAVVPPGGQRTTMMTDADGRLTRVTDPAGESVQYTYSTGGLLRTMTDSRGNVYRYNYDNRGRLVSAEDPGGGITSWTRVATGGTLSVTITSPLSRTITEAAKTTAQHGQLNSSIGPDGSTTDNLFDDTGREVMKYPDGTIVTRTLAPDPRWGMMAPVVKVLSQTLPSGLTTTIVSTRTVRLADPGDPLSLLVLSDTRSINGRIFTTVYSATAHTLTSISPEGRRTTTTLDTHGHAVRLEVPGLFPVNMDYDSLGRLISLRQSDRVSVLDYDEQWRLVSVTDPLSGTIYFDYDPVGRVIRQTMPDGREIGFAYDRDGNNTSITPPGRPAHSFTYTAQNLQEDYVPPDIGGGLGWTHNAYNTDQQLTSVSRSDGTIVRLAYDSAGRARQISFPGGSISLTFDPASGNLTALAGPGASNLAYSYDGNLLVSANWSGPVAGSVANSYDENLRAHSELINGGNGVTYLYDRDGLLRNAGALALSYEAQNGLLRSSVLDSSNESYSFNGFREIATSRASYAGGELLSEQYTRDSLGRITQQIEVNAGVTHTYTYTYDLAGRLAEVKKDGVVVGSYTYDTNGNRTRYQGQRGSASAIYDAQDRLLHYGSNSYDHSANGALLSKQSTSGETRYSYDALGNLTTITLPNGSRIDYIIDGAGRRIGKKLNGVLVQGFLYRDSLSPVAELDGAGHVLKRFVYASRDNVPDYMIINGLSYRIFSDQLGSPRLVINTASGVVVQRIDYDEFGNVLADSNPGFQPFGFAGGLYDRDTKLTRFGERDYDAEIGRWTSKDPIQLAAGPNLYVYVANDPINWSDPLGLCLSKVSLPTRTGPTDFYIDSKVVQDILDLVQQAKAEGIPLTFNYSFRSTAEQTRIWDNRANNPIR